jgi:hypothetical protein
VRFVGDRGYVVTFRQTDPLYVLDLANPAKPVVAGELKINGFSAYLHPLGDHAILGIGSAANDQGQVQGFQMSVFDVKDAKNPRLTATATVKGGSSQATFDPHAFLWWGPKGLAVVPVTTYDQSGPSFQGAIGYGVSGTAINERGRISHPAQAAQDPQGSQGKGSPGPQGQSFAPPIERSIVVGSRLFTTSTAGVLSSDLVTLAPGKFASFG